MRKRVAWSCLLTIAVVSFRSQLLAVGSGGISNEVPSTEYLGNLLAITGSKSDPTIGYSNPAAVGDIGRFSAAAGLTYFNFSAERSGNNGTSDKMKTTNALVPNFGAVGQIGNERWGWGFAVVSPYGLQTEWSGTSNVRYVATKSKINMVDITPAVSYRPSEKFAGGFGIDYFLTFDASLEKKAPVDAINTGICNDVPALCPPTSGASDANSKLSGDGEQWGYHAGFLINPTPSHTFGLAYHSEVKTKIEGDLELTGLAGASTVVFGGTDYKTPVRTDLFYPQNVQFGYKYSRGDKWEAGVNLAWYDWSSNKQFTLVLPNATAGQQSIIGAPIPLNWRDVWSGTVGGFYRFSEMWKLNAGAYYLPAVYPESTFSPAVPDMNKIGLSIGPSFTKGAWSVDSVYNPLFYKSTKINNNIGQSSTGLPSADISGEYKAMIHIVGLSVKYKY